MRPVIQALLLADQIIEDKSTGKKTIVGVFNSFLITKNAAAAPPAQKVDEVRPGMVLRRGTRSDLQAHLSALRKCVPGSNSYSNSLICRMETSC